MVAVEPDEEPGGDGAPKLQQRRSRRLSDKLLVVFHSACDVQEFQVARQLLATLEELLSNSMYRSPTDRRRTTEALVAAHERLWNLQNSSRVM